MREKMSEQPPPAPTASAVGPCPTVIQIVGRPGTGSLPSTFAPPDHPHSCKVTLEMRNTFLEYIVDNFTPQGVVGWCDGAG